MTWPEGVVWETTVKRVIAQVRKKKRLKHDYLTIQSGRFTATAVASTEFAQYAAYGDTSSGFVIENFLSTSQALWTTESHSDSMALPIFQWAFSLAEPKERAL
jgi:hypothetical protein